jgi:hypothetical protein
MSEATSGLSNEKRKYLHCVEKVNANAHLKLKSNYLEKIPELK